MAPAALKLVKPESKALDEAAKEAEVYLKETKEMVAKADEAVVELVEHLERIRDEKLFKLHGFANMGKYVEQELGINHRDMLYLIVGSSCAKKLNIPKEKVVAIVKKAGKTKSYRHIFTKAKTIAEAEEMAEEAPKMTYDDMVNKYNSKNGKEIIYKKLFALFADQKKNVENALAAAALLSKSDKEGHNLDMICVDFLSGRMVSGDIEAGGMNDLLKGLERAYGVKFMVVRGENVVWGRDLLASLKS